MTLKNLLFIFVICVLLLGSACEENKIQQHKSDTQYLKELSAELIPQKVVADSLIITIPGKNGFKEPTIIYNNIPPPVEITSPYEVVPGISFLQQSFSEKLAEEPAVKSKKPEIINIDRTKIREQHSKQYNSPIITILPQEININHNNLSSYEKIINESRQSSNQHNDSILPPISLLAARPRQIKALPMKHKENASFNIRFLDADQELPNSFIRAIAKDKDGILWFGTHTGGLISYNGQFFNHYTTKTGLSSDMILSLLIDKNNTLWIGTQGSGVNRFNGKTITQYTKKQGLPSNNITDILEDDEGNIWFATPKGVSSYNGSTISTYTKQQGLASNNITTLCEDDYGNIWFGTHERGVSKYDGKYFTTYTREEGLTSDTILSIKKDHIGNIWFGTFGGGVSKFNGQVFTNYTTAQGLGSDIILSITEDSDNNMWFGTFGDGITCFDGESFSYYTTKEGLSDNYIRTLFEDGNDNLLIGTDGGGVCNFNLHSFINYTKEQGLTDNLVLSILQDNQGRLWFGTFEGGVTILDESVIPGQQSTFTHITAEQGLANNIVLASMQDTNGDFWFGTYGGGVSKLDGSSLNSGILKFTNYSTKQGLLNNIVRSVLQDDEGNMWFGTESGVTKFDGSKFVTITEKAGLGSSKILSIFQDREGYLWFGTMDGGVAQLKNDSVIQYTTNHGLGDNTVWSITQDHNGNMWFGTNGGGLTSFDGHSFKTYNTENGLCNNYVYSLVRDHNNSIWAGTTRGLTQIDVPDNLLLEEDSLLNNKYVLINYGKVDGLKDIDFYTNSVFHDNKNRIWWGTGKALSLLELNTFKTPEDAPNVQINGLIINNKTINFNELIRTDKEISQSGIYFSDVSPFSNNPINLSLPHNLNHLTFQFTATYWSTPNQIQYQYKLKGFDKEWSLVTKDNIADYRNIPPGHFSFLLKAISKSGNWSKITEYPFIIRKPWWLAWWVIILYILTFVLVFWLIIKWRVNIVLKQKIILENLILDRTKELDNALSLAEQATIAKSQFIATMSHEIRTPLNAILGFTHLAIDSNLNPKQKDYLQKIDRSSNTLLSLINDILDFSKIEANKMQLEKVNFDLEIVLNSIIILNSQYTRKKNLEFIVRINPNVPRFLIGDPLRLGQVITNLCSNAIKFTSSGGITINVEIDKKLNNQEIYLQIAITDTGIGISKDQIPFLFDEFKQADNSITREYGGTGLGLAISKSLIEMMDGHIWLKSKPNKGTTFFFNCKVGVQPGYEFSSYVIPDKLKELNVLVCEDHPLAMQSIVSTLQLFLFNIDVVSSGEKVLEQFVKKPYDLLIIDLQSCSYNNMDIINSIHKNPNSSSTKIITISNVELGEKGYEYNIYNVNDYLIKPFLPSVLLDKILSVFEIRELSINEQSKQEINYDHLKETLSGNHILLAEDNETNQQVIYELMKKVDIKVDIAKNGVTAVNMARETNYEIILMDLHMPLLDGYNASAQIRKFNTQVPIIAITADSVNTVAARCNEVGITDIITKPIDPLLLYNTILKWAIQYEEPHIDTNKLSDEFNRNITDIVIHDLDIQTGIHRFGGNKKLYIKMLKKFLSTNNQTCSDLRKLVQAKEFEKAHLLIHTLKGESGNIGANKIHELSKLVEQAILKKDISSFDNEIQLLETSMKDIILEAQNYFKETADLTEIDPRSIRELIVDLLEALHLKDPSTFDLLDELALRKIDKSELDAISKAINNNDITEALTLLKNYQINMN